MGKKLLLLITIFLSMSANHNALAVEQQDLGPMMQRQFKQIQELKAKVTELEKSISSIQATLAKNVASNNVTTASTPLANIGENVATIPISSPDAANNFLENNNQHVTLPTPDNDKTAYDLALAALKESNFVSAEKQFTDFMANYPNSKFHGNALFWYAETFYRRENFNKAAINYLQCYKQFPSGVKAPDALLKLSYSLYALNKNSEACNIISKLETEFPNRSQILVKRSEEAKVKFHCK